MPPTDEAIRVLLLADSHLGFDHPVRPRIRRRRRGEDFLANHHAALAAAVPSEVDLVVHGGDLFHKPDVHPSLVHQAFAPLKQVADRGIPVFLVPGNHERSRIPFRRLARHPGVHVFGEPGTVQLRIGGVAVAVSGVPCLRRRARARFQAVVAATGWEKNGADARLLVTHQAFEGATVGPADFVFRRNHDVIRHRDVPAGFAAVLSGHIHRHQVLLRDLAGRPLDVPVLYPGSVERTAFAEMAETKGFVRLRVTPGGDGGHVEGWTFHPLYARPMRDRTLDVTGSPGLVEARLRAILDEEPADAVLRVRAEGVPRRETGPVLSASNLRRLAPATMNLSLRLAGDRSRSRSRGPRPPARRTGPPAELELELGLTQEPEPGDASGSSTVAVRM